MLPCTKRFLPHHKRRWSYVRVRGPVRRRRRWRWRGAASGPRHPTPPWKRTIGGVMRDVADKQTMSTGHDPQELGMTSSRKAERPNPASGTPRHHRDCPQDGDATLGVGLPLSRARAARTSSGT